MSPGVVVLVVAVAAALGFGSWRAVTDGRFRGTRAVRRAAGRARDATDDEPESPGDTPAPLLAGTPWAADLGERATLVQFSSAFCAPCRATRRVLADVAGMVPGVRHIEVDAEQHLDLVRRVGVLRTPTTLVLDAEGREVSRAAGAPTKQAVIASLGRFA
jgi:thiol-disulfide isomerase/thioredoxin